MKQIPHAEQALARGGIAASQQNGMYENFAIV